MKEVNSQYLTPNVSNIVETIKEDGIFNESLENEQFLASVYNDTMVGNKKEDEIWSKYL